jgi:hypothetical protein
VLIYGSKGSHISPAAMRVMATIRTGLCLCVWALFSVISACSTRQEPITNGSAPRSQDTESSWVFRVEKPGPFGEEVYVAVSPTINSDTKSVRSVTIFVVGGPAPSRGARVGSIVTVGDSNPVVFRTPSIRVRPANMAWGDVKAAEDVIVTFE